ncbi:hypothetical protein JYU34_012645 [Plutella xylostella]|uniref:Uncharacterized protein n=1 Tax=Plutella xylostella TaxID=51655 RepID=A0ABQ7QC37_PLUXY|nr:hypothetical protein JYU34_012645 [Plutella xylostella]
MKRTIMENRKKLTMEEMNTIKSIYKMADLILVRFLYMHKNQVWNSPEGQAITIYFRDISEVFMLGKFCRGRLQRWVYSTHRLHGFLPELDQATLSRAKYAELLGALDSYYLSVNESDTCMASIPDSPEPWDLRLPLTRCRRHAMCDTALLQSPSIGYSLAHRALNLILRRLDRRCYIVSEARDLVLIDQLCAGMYREAVYIARRGYFARDMFMEHVAICSMMGYEEFHRASWYRRVASFVDNIGCATESNNFLQTSQRVRLNKEYPSHILEIIQNRLRSHLMNDRCHEHVITLSMVMMAQAIRHSLFHLKKKYSGKFNK